MQGWYRSRDTDPTVDSANPWKPAFRHLGKKTEKAPVKKKGWKVYSSEQSAKVTAAAGPSKNIGQRNEVAKKLFEQESQEVQDLYTKQAEELYAQALKQYQDSAVGDPSDDPAVQES